MAGSTGRRLIKRLHSAIATVRLLLSFRATRWLLIRSASGSRRISSDEYRQGLHEFLSPEYSRSNSSNVSEYFDAWASPSRSPSPGLPQRQPSRSSSRVIIRTLSGVAPAAPIVVISRTPTEEEEAAADTAATSGGHMSRTESGFSSSGDEDIDKKAEEFIRRFRQRLARETSLEIRYIRKDSSGRSDSP